MKSIDSVKVLLSVALLSALSAAQTKEITRVSVRLDGRQVGIPPGNSFPSAGGVTSISDDGRFVAMYEDYPLGPVNVANVRLLDRLTGAQTLPISGAGGATPDSFTSHVLLSGDGSKIALTSYAGNLAAGPTNNHGNVYLVDRVSGATTRVTTGIGFEPNSRSESTDISTDGRFVVYRSYAFNLVPGDTNQAQDVFRFDALTGQTTRISFTASGAQSASDSDSGKISNDGRFVVFSCHGDDMVPGDTNHSEDVFLRDVQLGTTELISITPGGTAGNDISRPTWVSADGRYVIFFSAASDLVVGDNNLTTDFFLRDRQSGTTSLITLTSSGAPLDAFTDEGVVSRSGRYLFFPTDSGTVVPGDTNNQTDLFVRDMLANTTTLLSTRPSGAPIPTQPTDSAIFPICASSDGRFAAVWSINALFIDGDSNEGYDGFLIDRQSPNSPVTTYCTAKVTSTGCTPVITSAGAPSAAGNDSFYISASQVRAGKRGVFAWSFSSASTPFGGGTLCLGTPANFASGVASGSYGGTNGACNQGQFVFKVSQAFLAANGMIAGTTVNAQFISRDQGFSAPNNVGLSDAIRFTVAP